MSSSSHDSPITDPNLVTNHQLRNMSLRSLSRNLPLSISSRSTMSIYLRWLEIHRQERSRRTEHWSNTIMHWCQSLASRRFHVSGVIAEVSKWKEHNGPFSSKYHRLPPTQVDIERAFKEIPRTYENRKLADGMGESYRPLESDSKWKDKYHEKSKSDESQGEGYSDRGQRSTQKK